MSLVIQVVLMLRVLLLHVGTEATRRVMSRTRRPEAEYGRLEPRVP